jgi:hypothetical protein
MTTKRQIEKDTENIANQSSQINKKFDDEWLKEFEDERCVSEDEIIIDLTYHRKD